jgi:hypothetical protein
MRRVKPMKRSTGADHFIDGPYVLSEVPEALSYMQDGGLLGKIIITPQAGSRS